MKTGKIVIIGAAMAAVGALGAGRAAAQDFEVSGEVRPRSEARSGYQTPLLAGQDPVLLTQNRSRLRFDFGSERLEARFTAQDARTWGADGQKSDMTSLSLFEGWARYYFAPGLSLTVGRQALAYDRNRLFSASSWDLNGKAHDLALVKYHSQDLALKVDAGFAVNQTGAPLRETPFAQSFYQRMGFARAEKGFGAATASAVFVAEGFQDLATDSLGATAVAGHTPRMTTGANFDLAGESPLGLQLTGYYQFGGSRRATTVAGGAARPMDLSAYLLTANASLRLGGAVSVYVAADIYSGTAEGATRDNTWEKLYGSNHSFNGSMEYWRNTPAAGLHDYFGGVKAKLAGGKLSADLSYHYFAVQKAMAALDGRGLGSEIDLKLTYKAAKEVAFEVGYSTYFNSANTKIMKGIAPGADTRFQQWGYAMITFTPKFFSTKPKE